MTQASVPLEAGHVVRDGVRLAYEVHGTGERAIVLLPTWSIVPARLWKAQVPFLARHARVVVFDGRGNGGSDRPAGAAAYAVDAFVADTLAVMDATGTARATLVAVSRGGLWAAVLAADRPERVDGLAFLGPSMGLAPYPPEQRRQAFDEPLDAYEGWAKYNSHYWRAHQRAFVEFFFGQCFSEPHSTKQIEDTVGWGLGTTPDVLVDSTLGPALPRAEPIEATCRRVRCPVLVIHGDDDRVRPPAEAVRLAELTGGRLVLLEGGGHLPLARDPVGVNLLLRDFACPPAPPARAGRGPARPRRVLFVSSPIGLGHARRDVAIARELRRRHPGLEIDWLAQHPVTAVLAAAGERVHPASAALASESAHICLEARGHELRCFEAIRRMDELLVANFMVFLDLVRERSYDLWVGDEAWELDFFLHEHPELKTAPFAWLTDFVGWLPMPAGGAREAALTADLNAEMIEHVARHPRVRDRALFLGDPADCVPDRLGPGLPRIRDWTAAHFEFCGYVTGFEDAEIADRSALRAELGWAGGEAVCVAAVGGSGVGEALLRRVVAALGALRRLVPGLRLVAVAGPRIDPASLPAAEGLEVRAYVPDLHRLLAACDVAVVQGGLATTMELTAARRPFLFVPLEQHFEQQVHVRHRLARHRAGRAIAFDEAGPEALAAAVAHELGRAVDPVPVVGGAAARAAEALAELL